MISKERFKDLVYKMEEYNELYDKLYDLGIDILNCKYMEITAIFFEELMRSEFGEEGGDLVSWWMYEDVDHKIYETSEHAKEFCYSPEQPEGRVIADVNHIDDLYDYLIAEYCNKK